MPSLVQWYGLTRAATWQSPLDVVKAMPTGKALNGERVRFAVHGGKYRLVVSFDFRFGVGYVKFIGTHAEYDKIDALTVEQF